MRLSPVLLTSALCTMFFICQGVLAFGQTPSGDGTDTTKSTPVQATATSTDAAKAVTPVQTPVTAEPAAVKTPDGATDKKSRKDKKNQPAGRIPEAPSADKSYRVDGGRMMAVKIDTTALAKLRDSLALKGEKSLADSVAKLDTVIMKRDSLAAKIAADTAGMSKRELRHWRAKYDSTYYRQSPIFRDSMSISKMSWISVVVPGFSQLYNEQYWKIPILYGSVGMALYFGIKENDKYQVYKKQYDNMKYNNATQDEKTPVEEKMIRHNTNRQLLFAAAAASYIYFIGDGVMNYPNYATPVKKATTLSTICPGAGQLYNKSYWKVPIVIGGFVTFGYLIDFNSRNYKRFQLAYNQNTDGDPDTVDEFGGRYSPEFLRNSRNKYRRDRDLCIIMTGVWYLLNIVDAHVDAHFRNYDISDDLSMNLQPTMINMTTMRKSNINGFGLAFTMNF